PTLVFCSKKILCEKMASTIAAIILGILRLNELSSNISVEALLSILNEEEQSLLQSISHYSVDYRTYQQVRKYEDKFEQLESDDEGHSDV
ncbi:hypothetical protein, partial [Citrobacter braakii]|uniref:hypothetical protein n=1 Tax=Citrobacter braakii TaxID=57706 RepID=UPI001C12BD74